MLRLSILFACIQLAFAILCKKGKSDYSIETGNPIRVREMAPLEDFECEHVCSAYAYKMNDTHVKVKSNCQTTPHKPFLRNECIDDALNNRPEIWCFSLEKPVSCYSETNTLGTGDKDVYPKDNPTVPCAGHCETVIRRAHRRPGDTRRVVVEMQSTCNEYDLPMDKCVLSNDIVACSCGQNGCNRFNKANAEWLLDVFNTLTKTIKCTSFNMTQIGRAEAKFEEDPTVIECKGVCQTIASREQSNGLDTWRIESGCAFFQPIHDTCATLRLCKPKIASEVSQGGKYLHDFKVLFGIEDKNAPQ